MTTEVTIRGGKYPDMLVLIPEGKSIGHITMEMTILTRELNLLFNEDIKDCRKMANSN